MNFYRKNDNWPPAASDLVLDVVMMTPPGFLLIVLDSDQLSILRHKISFSEGPK